MKLRLLQNGKDRGWGIVHSLFDFFFPLEQRLRVEAITHHIYDEQGFRVTGREFFTLRAFAVHYWNTLCSPAFRVKEYLRDPIANWMLHPERGAIAIDTSTNSGTTALYNTTTGSFNHTCTGSNLVLGSLIGVYFTTISSETYNSVALTQAALATNSDYRAYSHYILSPSTGTNSLAVTYAATGYGAGSAISFSGADTSGIGATQTGTGTSDTPTLSITTIANNSYVIDIVKTDGSEGTGTSTAGAGQTKIGDQETANVNHHLTSYEPVAVAGATTMDWDLPGVGGGAWAQSAFEIKQGATVGGVDLLQLLGIT